MANLHAGSAKTVAQDVFIIAKTAPTIHAALRSIAISDEQLTEPNVLVGFDGDVLGQTVPARNRVL